MGRVKGTLLIDFVKVVRSEKTGLFNPYLTDQDRQIISQRILASEWYPAETYKNLFNAVVKVGAKGDMEMVRQWGRVYGEKIITNIYKTLVADVKPMEVISKYKTIVKRFHDFGETDCDQLSRTSALMTIKNFFPEFEPVFHLIRGWIERNLELSGAKDVKSEFIARSWQGAPATIIKFTWTE